MNETVLTTIALTGFSVAFFHAAIPTHWLPFIAAGRAQGWTRGKTLAVTAFAGSGHVLATALLGLVLTLFGVVLQTQIGTWFSTVAGTLLILLGLFYIWRQLSGHSRSHTHLFSGRAHDDHEHAEDHEHHHHHHDHAKVRSEVRKRLRDNEEPDEQEYELKKALKTLRGPAIVETRTSDRIAIMSLFALLTLSPCEGFLPIYVSGIRFGWSGFFLLTLVLSAATVAGMLVFTALTLAGLRRIQLGWFERHESAVMGSLLVLIGLLVMLFEV